MSKNKKYLPHELSPTHIIIGGIVFPWAAKAPYVDAGKSVLGALEYNQQQDRIKCHVCGEWVKRLAMHLSSSDGVKSAEYRTTYGLNLRTPLYVPSLASKFKNHPQSGSIAKYRKLRPPSNPARPHVRAELRNLRGLCFAQIRTRVLLLALEIGGTPTKTDLELAGIAPKTIIRTYEVPLSAFMQSLGLTPNPPGAGKRGPGRQYVREPLPIAIRQREAQLRGTSL